MKLMHIKSKEKSGKRRWYIRYRWQLLAFLIPIVVAATAFICQGVWPFGSRGISIIDSYHQYVPFFSELQYKWRHLDSMAYTWHGGLGTNFISIYAYYLASPLNLLLILMPRNLIMETFAIIYLLKIGLCGLTFYTYLSRRLGKGGLTAVVFSVTYALSGYVIGYGWNIMWLDCIALLPIILMGLEKLVHQRDGLTYGLALALCIYCNYYISIMICIFLCLYFAVQLILMKRKTIRKIGAAVGRFTGYSLLSGAFGAVMLLPAFCTLLSTKSAESEFPTAVTFYTETAELFGQHLAAVAPTSLTGDPNLYCGLFILLLIPLYWMNKKIDLKEKIIYSLLAAFMLFSLNMNILAYIWQGFHFPNGLPGRFSFIYIFLLIRMGYEGFIKRSGWPKYFWFLSAVPACVLLGWSVFHQVENISDIVFWINIALTGIYIVLIGMAALRWKGRRSATIALVSLFLVEICGNSVYGLCANGTVDRKGYYSDQDAVEELKGRVAAQDDSFYRMEVEERRGRDDVTWHNLPGMSLFSSTVNAGTDNLMRRLGFYAVTNKYSYEGATPETDAILNIKYLLSNKKQETIRTFEWEDSADGKNLYKNDMALGQGFMVSEDILNWDYEQTNPFNVLNSFNQAATGSSQLLYQSFGIGVPEAEGCSVEQDTWADFSYSHGEEGGTLTWTYTAQSDEEVYIYFKATRCERLRVETPEGSASYTDEDGHIVEIGNLSAGDTVTLTFELDDAYESGTIKLIGGRHDIHAFYGMVDALRQSTWRVDEYTSTMLSGTVQAAQDGILFTSVPYEEGWTVYVDGKEVEAEAIGGGLIGIPLEQGEHIVKMVYKAPGYFPGICITLGAALIFGLILWRRGMGKNYKILQKCKI
ncbi:MAG TPA: YfhO family protein [Candidatus Onthocola gallistercoris]|uniref:YfhO family protein n=1 Tax=Candidatus Onthocola gallistercoris TaxID=2840876 RepID=A0A9D1HFT7_9FIRM|nr:YfhO family protein [Candidatus Onthocola gallistercoris]